MLVAVDLLFVLLLFLVIIIVIAHKARQRKKSVVIADKNEIINDSESKSNKNEIINDSESKSDRTNQNKSTINKSGHNSNNHKNKSPLGVRKPQQTKKSVLPTNSYATDSKKSKFSDMIDDNPPVKKIFNRANWTFRNNQSIESKIDKFQKAVTFCAENNLGSQAKFRRLRIKIVKWGVENERDMDALISEYTHLLDLIEEFETRD